jgi:hypothetical protein
MSGRRKEVSFLWEEINGGYWLRRILLGARGLFGVIFFGLAAPAFAGATLDALVNAAARFSAAFGQQLVLVQNDPAPAEFAEKTVAYAEAKTAYFTALREAMPELINTATRRKLRPLQLDNFIAAFAVAGEKQEKAVDEKTVTLLERLSGNADVEKARAEFERAQKVEETFQKDFDGIDFTIYFFGIRVRFCEPSGAGFLSLVLPRIYSLVLWGFTL